VVRQLLESKAAVNQVVEDGTTPLSAACRNGHSDVVHDMIRAAVQDYKQALQLFETAQTMPNDIYQLLLAHTLRLEPPLMSSSLLTVDDDLAIASYNRVNGSRDRMSSYDAHLSDDIALPRSYAPYDVDAVSPVFESSIMPVSQMIDRVSVPSTFEFDWYCDKLVSVARPIKTRHLGWSANSRLLLTGDEQGTISGWELDSHRRTLTLHWINMCNRRHVR